jgi:hypothetical protein
MSDRTPILLDRLWDDIPTGRAPIEDLLAAGRVARRRTRRRYAVGVAAVVVLALGGGVLGAGAVRDRHSGAPAAVEPPDANHRLVGIGQVVVAVPRGWADNPATCNNPYKDTAFFPYGQDCFLGGRYVSSVAITSETNSRTSGLVPDGDIGGHQVVSNRATCPVGQGESCSQVFGVPDLDAYFTVRVPEDTTGGAINLISGIRDSLTVLPATQTAVPFFTPGTTVEYAQRSLEAAGLSVVVNHRTCPPNAFCISGLTSMPTAGSVVDVGSTVVLDVM